MLLSPAEVTIGAITRRSYNRRSRLPKLSPLPSPSKVITDVKPAEAIIGANASQSYHWCLQLKLSSMPMPAKVTTNTAAHQSQSYH